MKLQFSYYDIKDLVDEVAPGCLPWHFKELLASTILQEIGVECVVTEDRAIEGLRPYCFTFNNEEDMLIFQLRYVG